MPGIINFRVGVDAGIPVNIKCVSKIVWTELRIAPAGAHRSNNKSELMLYPSVKDLC